jgi:hypothetical protein
MTVAVSLAHRVIICKEGVDLSSLLTVGIFYKIVNVISKKYVYNILYIEYHNVSTLDGIGALPTPLSQASVPLPPESRGGGKTSLRVRG